MTDPSSPKPKKLLDQLRDAIRLKYYSYSTEKTYVHWVRRYILYHNKRHPAEMGPAEIEAFLAHLAKEEQVSASTQNQAFSALLFLYRNVLQIDLPVPIHILRAKRSEHLPTVLSKDEVARVLSGMQGLHQLMGKLLYGCGLRLMECLRLRVKDIDFEQSQIIVREGKGEKDRVTMLPAWFSPSRNRSPMLRNFMNKIYATDSDRLNFLLRLPANTPMQIKNWAGNIFFHRKDYPSTHVVELCVVTIWTPAGCSGRSKLRRNWWESTSPSARTPSAIALPLTCSKQATTSGLFRNY